MADSDLEVRRMASRELGAAAVVLARAFLDDPLYVWAMPDRRRRERLLPRYMRSLPLTAYGSLGPTLVAVVDGAVVGALVRAEPARRDPGWRALARALPGMLGSAGPAGVARLFRLDAAVGAVRPDRPHRYLFHLGTDPGWWGRGVGSALLRSALADSDAGAEPTYLECGPDTVAYYERFGFAVTEPVPIGSVALRGMVRPADPRR